MSKANIKNWTYFDNAATTLIKPESVAKALYESVASQDYGNPSRGAHMPSMRALRSIYETRYEIAELFGVKDPLSVVLCSNVTTALNLAIKSTIKEGHIITSDSEHNSVLRPLFQLEDIGVQLSFLPLREDGSIKLEELENLLRKDTRAVVITQASNVSGHATDMDKVYDFCIENDLLLIVDGAQGAGTLKLKFDERKLPNMIYCFTGHKSLYGPQGTGGMIIIGDVKVSEVFTGGSGIDSFNEHQPKIIPDIFEYGTQNVHSNMGLKEGVRYIRQKGIDTVEKNLYSLTKKLYTGLKENKNIEIYNDIGLRHAPIASINYRGKTSQELSDILWDKFAIATRSGSHCAPKYHISMKTKERGMTRISLSTFNSEREIEYLLNILELIK